ncbi:uncharacterized protein [Diabrotica undecimpunctata]|uniref:uncharacterized protein n=1 Tax=Diabrotica undecimpunctata TaxID=50387 RepID=UPI003B640B2D
MVRIVEILSIIVIFISATVEAYTVYQNGLDVPVSIAGNIPVVSNPINLFRDGLKRRCPVCDPSVYSYCTDKLLHDSCCCHNPNNPYDQLPYQCKYADCSFLHANTCQEHKLITACCCTSLYLYKK